MDTPNLAKGLARSTPTLEDLLAALPVMRLLLEQARRSGCTRVAFYLERMIRYAEIAEQSRAAAVGFWRKVDALYPALQEGVEGQVGEILRQCEAEEHARVEASQRRQCDDGRGIELLPL